MKNSQRKALIIHRGIVIIFLFVAFIFSLLPFFKTMGILWDLFIIGDSISFIEETADVSPAGWSDSLIADYQKYINLRNDMINSNDKLEAFLSSSGDFLRVLVVIATLILPSILAFCIYYLSKMEILDIKKFIKYQRKSK